MLGRHALLGPYVAECERGEAGALGRGSGEAKEGADGTLVDARAMLPPRVNSPDR